MSSSLGFSTNNPLEIDPLVLSTNLEKLPTLFDAYNKTKEGTERNKIQNEISKVAEVVIEAVGERLRTPDDNPSFQRLTNKDVLVQLYHIKEFFKNNNARFPDIDQTMRYKYASIIVRMDSIKDQIAKLKLL